MEMVLRETVWEIDREVIGGVCGDRLSKEQTSH